MKRTSVIIAITLTSQLQGCALMFAHNETKQYCTPQEIQQYGDKFIGLEIADTRKCEKFIASGIQPYRNIHYMGAGAGGHWRAAYKRNLNNW